MVMRYTAVHLTVNQSGNRSVNPGVNLPCFLTQKTACRENLPFPKIRPKHSLKKHTIPICSPWIFVLAERTAAFCQIDESLRQDKPFSAV